MNIRLAHPEDAEALLAIYGQYIDTSITFEYELPSRAEFEGRIREFSRDYPYLVCEDGGKIVGYGYAHRAMERAAYQWNAELSVYLDRDSRAKGLGKKLCLLLMELLRLQGIRTVYSVVTSPNPRSERLQQAPGQPDQRGGQDGGAEGGRARDEPGPPVHADDGRGEQRGRPHLDPHAE